MVFDRLWILDDQIRHGNDCTAVYLRSDDDSSVGNQLTNNNIYSLLYPDLGS